MKKKKIVIGLTVVALAVAGFVVLNQDTQEQEVNTYIRTTTLTKSSLDSVISTTGVVSSLSETAVSSTVSNVKISNVYVEVGDFVNEGDVLVTLEQEKLNEQITDLNEDIADAKELLQQEYDDALAKKDAAWTTVFKADGTQSVYTQAKTQYENAKLAVSSAQAEYDLASTNHQTAVLNLANAQNLLNQTDVSDPNYATIQNDVQIKTNELNATVVLLDEKLASLKSIKDSTGYDTLEKSYTLALENYNTTLSQYQAAESTLAQRKEDLDEGSNTQLETLNTQLETLLESKENYTLKAQSTGTVTEVNATVGALPSMNQNLVTIHDTDALKIEVQVNEDDIQSIEIGQSAVVLSDATDAQITGEVVSKSPVATTSGQGSTSSTFTVSVEVTSSDSGLLIGMNTQVDIVLESVDDVFIVPLDAIETQADKTYVYKQISEGNTEESFERIEVITKESNDYYVEITGDEISEGVVIRSSAILEDAEVSTEFEMPFGPTGTAGQNAGMGAGERPSGQAGGR